MMVMGFTDLDRKLQKIGRLGRGGMPPSAEVVAARIQKSALLKGWPPWAAARIRLQTGFARKTRSYKPLHGLDKILDIDFRIEHRNADRATEREYFSIRRTAMQISTLIESWEPSQLLRPPCFFCARSARKGYAEMPNPELPSLPDRVNVCQSHAPGTPGWRRAKRLVRWAGGLSELGAKYNDQMRRIRREIQQINNTAQITPKEVGLGIASEQDWARHVHDAEIWYGKSMAKCERDLVGDQDCDPANDFAVYAESRHLVEAEYARQTQAARAANARRVGKLGGRPPGSPLSQAQKGRVKQVRAMSAKGLSQASIAARMGLSQPTVSRLLKIRSVNSSP